MATIRSIRDIRERFEANWDGYLARYWIWLFLLAVAAIADMLSTVFFMVIDGPQAELHPLIRLISMVLGPVTGPVVGKLFQFATVIVVTVFLRRWALYIFVVVIILYAWAAAYNMAATPLLVPAF